MYRIMSFEVLQRETHFWKPSTSAFAFAICIHLCKILWQSVHVKFEYAHSSEADLETDLDLFRSASEGNI